MSITEKFESLPKLLKCFMMVMLPVSCLYRIAKYTETKNTLTLVVAILIAVMLPVNIVAMVIDLITEITSNAVTVLAD